MKVTRPIAPTIAALFALTLGLAACSSASGANGSSGETIKVGAILSLSGGGSVFGQSELRSMQLAVETVNSNGGVDGKKIQLLVQDDKSQPSEAVTVARSLITNNQVSAIFGSSSGSSTLAFMPIATSENVPVLTPDSTVSIVGNFPKDAYRTTPSDTIVVDAVVKYLKEHKLTRVGLLTESAAFGAQAGDAIQKQVIGTGVNIVDREVYDPSAVDLTTELTKIRSANPDIIIVWGTGPAPSIAFKNMLSLGMSSLPRMAPLGVATESNISLAEGAMDGVLIPGVIDAQHPADSAQKQFVSVFQGKYHRMPTTLDAIAWDPAFLLQQAGNSAHSTEPAKLQSALDTLCNFQGAVGEYCYKQSHDGLGVDAIKMVQIKGTDFVSVTTP